jgi:MFS superfamily sulfate permease-like transporter
MSGMFAVISLMTGTLVSEAKQEILAAASSPSPSLVRGYDTSTAASSSPSLTTLETASHYSSPSVEFEEINIQIAVAVSFLIGVYQLVFGFLQIGFVSVYLSEHLVSGFTTAASLYVFTSQVSFSLSSSAV